jgi:hypothetical protein
MYQQKCTGFRGKFCFCTSFILFYSFFHPFLFSALCQILRIIEIEKGGGVGLTHHPSL